jgi:MFS family permease
MSFIKNNLKINVFSPFKYRDFTYLWLGGVTAGMAMSMKILISTQWLYDETGSSIIVGLLGIAQLIQMPVVIYGGVMADVSDRKKLMVYTQLVSFLLLLFLGILAQAERLMPWHVFFVIIITGITNMLGNSSRPAMLPRVIPKQYITEAIGLSSASFQVSSIISPLIFWKSFEYLGPAGAFYVAASIAFVSVFSPLMINASGESKERNKEKAINSIKEGYKFISTHPILPGLYLLDIFVTIVSFYRNLFPVFSSQLYSKGVEGTGLLNAFNSFGTIFGASIVMYTSKLKNKGQIVLVATFAYSLLLMLFGINKSLYIGLGLVALLGLTDGISMVMRQAIVQLTTPDRLLGRASSAHSFTAMGANHIGHFEVGLLSAIVGAGTTMLLGGIIASVVTLLFWVFYSSIRNYRYVSEL